MRTHFNFNFNIIREVYANCKEEKLAANRDGFYFCLRFPRNLFDNTTENLQIAGIAFTRHDNLYINETFCRKLSESGFNAYEGLEALFDWAIF